MLTGMPKEVLYSKLVFIDSHDGVRGAKTLKPSFHIPSNAFGCSQGESMRLVLKSFTMPKSFYNINQDNNVFFYNNTDTNSLVEVKLIPGDYTADELKDEIQTRVRATPGLGGTFTVAYDTKTRKFTFTIPSNYPSGYFVSFFDKNETTLEYRNDANEVLGGTPSTDVNAPVNMFAGGAHTFNGGTTTVASKYPIRLSTIENIYLRCSLQGDAYCSTSYEVNKTGNKLDNTDIWAAIPNVTNANDNIVLEDNSEDYQIHIKSGQLTDIKFNLSDGKGRTLPLVTDTQAEDGNINFNLVFKFEILSEPHEAHIVTGGVAQYRQPPEMTK